MADESMLRNRGLPCAIFPGTEKPGAALGEKAVDQLAESELGRLALRRARAGAGDPGRTMRGIGRGTSRAFVLPEPLWRAGANSG